MLVNDRVVKRCNVPTGCSEATLESVCSREDTRLGGLVVAGDEVFFWPYESYPYSIHRCPVDGCPDTPEQVPGPDDERGHRIGVVVAGPDALYWTRDDRNLGPFSRRCALPECTTTSEVRVVGNVDYNTAPARELTRPSSVVSVGANSVLWGTGGLGNDSTKQLRSCVLANPCTTPTEIDNGGAFVVALTYFDGHHYGISKSTSGSTIFRVSDAASTTTATPVAADEAGVFSIAVDASGIYWANGATGKILRCPKLDGCNAEEIETLAVNQTNTSRIRVDANNVYWQRETKILRLAKP